MRRCIPARTPTKARRYANTAVGRKFVPISAILAFEEDVKALTGIVSATGEGGLSVFGNLLKEGQLIDVSVLDLCVTETPKAHLRDIAH